MSSASLTSVFNSARSRIQHAAFAGLVVVQGMSEGLVALASFAVPHNGRDVARTALASYACVFGVCLHAVALTAREVGKLLPVGNVSMGIAAAFWERMGIAWERMGIDATYSLLVSVGSVCVWNLLVPFVWNLSVPCFEGAPVEVRRGRAQLCCFRILCNSSPQPLAKRRQSSCGYCAMSLARSCGMDRPLPSRLACL